MSTPTSAEQGGKSHRDYVSRIGGTAATARGFMARRWNRYYLFTYQRIVTAMLQGETGPERTVLDVGTSHGNWLKFLRSCRFGRILGVELDADRAELARAAGYDEVYNCDASKLPLPDSSVDVAVSNDVFVHILRSEDKVAVLKEVRRTLRTGGMLIINHSSARAFGFGRDTVVDHCSFLTLSRFLGIVEEAGGYQVEDIKPSYFTRFGRHRPTFLRQALVALPLGWLLLYWMDQILIRRTHIELSDYIYLKLRAAG